MSSRWGGHTGRAATVGRVGCWGQCAVRAPGSTTLDIGVDWSDGGGRCVGGCCGVRIGRYLGSVCWGRDVRVHCERCRCLVHRSAERRVVRHGHDLFRSRRGFYGAPVGAGDDVDGTLELTILDGHPQPEPDGREEQSPQRGLVYGREELSGGRRGPRSPRPAAPRS